MWHRLLTVMCISLSCGFLNSCHDSLLFISSPNGKHTISVYESGDFLYIIDGKINRVSDTAKSNYAIFDIAGVPDIAKALFVCWQDSVGKLEILMPRAQIVNTQLPELDFQLHTEHEKNEKGVPNIAKYHQQGCFEFDFSYKRIFPNSHAIISPND